MKARIRSRFVRVTLATAVAVAAAAGFAVAAIPGADGVIKGCYVPSGVLRVIDEADRCRDNETALSWNQVGPQGPQGERGPQGPPGTAEAYAVINANGKVNAAFSRGITDANVTHPRTGVYCLRELAFQPLVAIGNGRAALRIEADGTLNAAAHDTVVTTALNVVPNPDTFLGICDDGTAVSTVRIYVSAGGVLVDRTFSILLDD